MTQVRLAGMAAPSGQRGRTSISERVLRKIAAHDAARQPGVYSVGKVRAKKHDHRDHSALSLRVEMNLTLAYPAPAATTAHRVRERVIGQLRRFTGYAVTAVDVVVSYEFG
ncbi:MAG: hypothetical protein DLM55_04250 [Acidimicrobiales bacterium]|nr:MAG: hypothetical protein DLM55_04250 [Acidimicrobiales bacterium]